MLYNTELLEEAREQFVSKLMEEAFTSEVEKQDISQAMKMSVEKTTAREFTQAVGIDPKTFFRIYFTIHEIVWNSDGSLTKFARDNGVKDFVSFYRVLKQIKQEIKHDHMLPGWETIREMYMVAYPKLLAKQLFTDPVLAVNFVQRTIWFVIDDLNTLRKVFKVMQYMQENQKFREMMFGLEKKFGAGIKKNES
jgi:hypothetical protein